MRESLRLLYHTTTLYYIARSEQARGVNKRFTAPNNDTTPATKHCIHLPAPHGDDGDQILRTVRSGRPQNTLVSIPKTTAPN
jgi:hypothetical protein